MPDLSEVIEEAAQKPKVVKADGVEVTEHSLPDLIAADRYAKEQEAQAVNGSGWFACRPARVVPPGSVGPSNRGG